MEEGKDTHNLQSRYPEISQAYGLYIESRNRTIVVAQLPKSKDSTTTVVTPYTTGYGPLPLSGGLMDQPYRLMELWSCFLRGDRMATIKSLSK